MAFVEPRPWCMPQSRLFCRWWCRSRLRFRRMVAAVFRDRVFANGGKAFQQLWQSRLYRFPHHIEVNVEITMRNTVAHTPHVSPRYFGMLFEKSVVVLQQPGGDLTDDDDVHDHRLLSALVGKEVILIHFLDVAARLSRGVQHVIDIVGKAAFAHTGRASARTRSRNLGGRSPGVRRSTGTPRSSSSSICSPPRSKRVAPGSGSTSRSRSLPSPSWPCNTEPKTRTFAVRKRRAASRTALRFRSRATEGFMGCDRKKIWLEN